MQPAGSRIFALAFALLAASSIQALGLRRFVTPFFYSSMVITGLVPFEAL